MLDRSFDNTTPTMVAISAINLISFGIVVIVVVCSVEIFVMVPTRIVASVNRISGLVRVFVSLWVLWLVRGCPVIVVNIICVL